MVKVKTWQIKTIWLLVGLFIWEASIRLGFVSEMQLPSSIDVVVAAFEGMVDGTLLLQLLQSIVYVVAGLLIGLVMAMFMASVGYYNRWFNGLFDVYASVLHPLPGVALIPIIFLWFGIGGAAIFAIIIHAVLWSQYLTLRDGFASVEPAYIDVAHNNGASKIQLLRHVLVPMSMNSIVLSLQVGWARGWRALISAEMIFGTISAVGGIGWYMYERRAFMDTTGMFAGVLMVVLVGVLIEQLVFNRWLPSLYRKS